MSEQVYTHSQFAPGFWVIEEKGVRCFLAEGTDRAMLVDTGYGGGDLKQYLSHLTDKPIFWSIPMQIWITSAATASLARR